jgi:predicted dehydrogenase
MNIALIGLGNIANCHIAAINSCSDFRLVGGFDLNPALAAKLPTGARFYSSAEELLADPQIETVALLVPAGEAKFELSRTILRAGKNIITEKPAVRNERELARLEVIAKEKRVFFHGAFHSRFSPTADYLHEQLVTGEYSGKVIKNIEIWADSPHIVDGKVVSKSSEATSFLAEGPNILSEVLVYVPQVVLTEARYVKFDEQFQEVYTQAKGVFAGGDLTATTSWIRGRKQKGVKIVFADESALVAIHTEQKVYDASGEVVFDGEILDANTSRMQKEYTALYRALQATPNELRSNFALIKRVAQLTDVVEIIGHEVSREQVLEIKRNMR